VSGRAAPRSLPPSARGRGADASARRPQKAARCGRWGGAAGGGRCLGHARDRLPLAARRGAPLTLECVVGAPRAAARPRAEARHSSQRRIWRLASCRIASCAGGGARACAELPEGAQSGVDVATGARESGDPNSTNSFEPRARAGVRSNPQMRRWRWRRRACLPPGEARASGVARVMCWARAGLTSNLFPAGTVLIRCADRYYKSSTVITQ